MPTAPKSLCAVVAEEPMKTSIRVMVVTHGQAAWRLSIAPPYSNNG